MKTSSEMLKLTTDVGWLLALTLWLLVLLFKIQIHGPFLRHACGTSSTKLYQAHGPPCRPRWGGGFQGCPAYQSAQLMHPIRPPDLGSASLHLVTFAPTINVEV